MTFHTYLTYMKLKPDSSEKHSKTITIEGKMGERVKGNNYHDAGMLPFCEFVQNPEEIDT